MLFKIVATYFSFTIFACNVVFFLFQLATDGKLYKANTIFYNIRVFFL